MCLASGVFTISRYVVENDAQILTNNVPILVLKTFAFFLSFCRNVSGHFVYLASCINVFAHFENSIYKESIPHLVEVDWVESLRDCFINGEVAMVRPRVTLSCHLGGKEHDPVYTVVKSRVPDELGHVVDESDRVESTRRHVPLHDDDLLLVAVIVVFYVSRLCKRAIRDELLLVLVCKCPFNKAQHTIVRNLNRIHCRYKARLAQSGST